MKWKWVRGEIIGRGSFGIVSLATLHCKSQFHIPPIIAVKSALFSQSSSLQKERDVLLELRDCRQILHCFGETSPPKTAKSSTTPSLADHFSYSCIRKLPESDVRRYTMSILKGLDYMHKKGYIHCDIKPSNVLVSSASDVKIADFGLAKRASEKIEGGKLYLRGTAIVYGAGASDPEQADVWSLGCFVAEMITGKLIWSCTENTNMNSILFRIGLSNEFPEIALELSDEGKDFLGKCFMRDPVKRWAAEMLLNHPFIANELMEEDGALFPRSNFNFVKWLSVHSSMLSPCSVSESFNDFEGESDSSNSSYSLLANRLRQLGTGLPLDSSSRDDDKIGEQNLLFLWQKKRIL